MNDDYAQDLLRSLNESVVDSVEDKQKRAKIVDDLLGIKKPTITQVGTTFTHIWMDDSPELRKETIKNDKNYSTR